jgi:hypothetical protein
MNTRVHQIGQTKITVHSPSGFIYKSSAEKSEWFRREYEAGNVAVRRIVEIVTELSMNAIG